MTEGKKESKKCVFDCKDVGHDCDWQCVADDEEQLYKEVKMHANIYHDAWNLSRDTISQFSKDAPSEIEE